MNFSHLTEFIDHLYEKEGIPSSQIVIRRDGKEIYYHAAGYQDIATGEPIRRDAIYFIYSCSKVITVTAAMQLLEKGAFLMNEPVSKYLPEFKDITVQTVDARLSKKIVPADHPMTIFHLFTMTSGLGYDSKMPEILATIEAKNGDPTTEDIVKAMASHPLQFHPGTHWLYSFSHDVLARLVEVISGQRFADYVKEHIFDPVGMKDSAYHMTEEMCPRMAAEYRFDPELNKAVDIGLKNHYIFGPRYDSGGAGVLSTLDDLMRFADTLTHKGMTESGKRILAGRTVDLMRTDCLNAMTRPDFQCRGEVTLGYGYGFGVRTMADPVTGGSLSPIGEFGWGGAAGSYVHCDPENRITIIYMQHMLKSKNFFVQPRLRNLIYSALEY